MSDPRANRVLQEVLVRQTQEEKKKKTDLERKKGERPYILDSLEKQII